ETACLNLVRYKKNIIVSTDLPYFLMKFRRRNDISALSLDRLHKNGSSILRAQVPPENKIFQFFSTFDPTRGILEFKRTAITIGIVGMGCAKRRKMFLLPDF